MKPYAYVLVEHDGSESLCKVDAAEYYMKHFPEIYKFIPLFKGELK